jgi:hypothetical protein
LVPGLKKSFDRGADRFLNRGVSGAWKSVATPEDTTRYDAYVRRHVSPSLAAWIATGRRGAGDPSATPD